jgi:hypothetical protein
MGNRARLCASLNGPLLLIGKDRMKLVHVHMHASSDAKNQETITTLEPVS